MLDPEVKRNVLSGLLYNRRLPREMWIFTPAIIVLYVVVLIRALRILSIAPEISGQKKSRSASVAIELNRPFDQNTRRSPPEPIIER